jgi:uncharacterized membrane protein
MAPFIVMLGSLLLFRGLGALGVPVFATWQECVRDAMVVLFLFTASSRLTPMREGLIRMVPKYIPYPRLLVYVTGALEALGAIGLLVPATRSAAGLCLAALLIALFPANVNAAVRHIPLRDQRRPTPLWLRLPMQLVYIGLVVLATL